MLKYMNYPRKVLVVAHLGLFFVLLKLIFDTVILRAS